MLENCFLTSREKKKKKKRKREKVLAIETPCFIGLILCSFSFARVVNEGEDERKDPPEGRHIVSESATCVELLLLLLLLTVVTLRLHTYTL